jgi:hypothetical protein
VGNDSHKIADSSCHDVANSLAIQQIAACNLADVARIFLYWSVLLQKTCRLGTVTVFLCFFVGVCKGNKQERDPIQDAHDLCCVD